ncbi:MAG: zinc ABC transporter substrate-binding protein [Acidobacteria bacterium]|jgi:zinc/manganese transport system substrate-binding protein|nr:zinc ABC transporter substrate-binding protein [Acidobacteriota bacterium]
MRHLSAILLLASLAAGGGSTAAEARLNVVATTSSMGMLARTVGGDQVKVTVLAPPDRDAHYLMAKPSMMVALRNADLLMAVGADLEIGWLPAALQGASNPKILPGTPGYFDGGAQLDLIEKGGAPDRSKGDVHPLGNPHYYLDPPRMAQLAGTLAVRMGKLAPAHAAQFEANASAFAKAVEARLPGWKQRAAGAPGVVFYHKDGNYLAALLNVPVLGYVEPLPGIPPTASSLKALVASLAGRKGVVIHTTFQPGDGPAFVTKNLGWTAQQLPLEVALDGDAAAYFSLIDKWVAAVASSRS